MSRTVGDYILDLMHQIKKQEKLIRDMSSTWSSDEMQQQTNVLNSLKERLGQLEQEQRSGHI